MCYNIPVKNQHSNCYPRETGFYYLQSRYYDPAIGRFINADSFASTGQNFVGYNMFTYCGNNPIIRADLNGQAWETVFDIISAGASIAEVIANPADPWAWLSLAGDIADVAIPFVGGLGEATKALKAVSNAAGCAEDAGNLIDITTNTLDVVKDASKILKSGDNSVYLAYTAEGLLEYVGITNDFKRRQKEWEGIRDIVEYIPNVDRAGARYVEQTIITLFGMKKNGGILSNAINSIGVKGSKYAGYIEFITDLLD